MRFTLRAAASLSLAIVLASVVTVFAAVTIIPDRSKPPTALWWVVRGLCVPDQSLLHIPAPCVKVDLKQGWAIVADPAARTHLLLVPTERLSGIESPALLGPRAPNYWQFAWDARSILLKRARRPATRQNIALAINAVSGRTQNQLHIHISCLKPDIAVRLRRRLGELDETWKSLTLGPLNHPVLARRLDGAQFGANDPFKILAAGVPDARTSMATRSLAAVGAVFPDGTPGFVLISHQADLAVGDLGVGEDILDFSCGILTDSSLPGD